MNTLLLTLTTLAAAILWLSLLILTQFNAGIMGIGLLGALWATGEVRS
ncbi:MAG TPA: hypothetical protein VKX16_08140 [Chloroflexota bacterium]|nr:hypothetical protein [Chloroflexota bacterium]